MNGPFKLAINYIKLHKKNTFAISACVLISTIFITVTLLLIDSYREYMVASERNNGNWEVEYKQITYNDAKRIESHDNVKEISVMSKIDEITTDDIINQIEIMGYDNNALNNLIKNSLLDGCLPSNSKELIGQIGSYKIGEKFISNKNIEYTIVGIVDYNNFINQNQLITLLDRNQLKEEDKVNVTVLSNNIKKIYNDYYDIYYSINSYNKVNLDEMTKYNKTLLEYEGIVDYVSDSQKDIYIVEGIFIGIIIISSMIFIYFFININLIERKKYFGILKSIGMTTKQMKRTIRIELLIILSITIPLGIAIGIIIDYLILTLVNNIAPEIYISIQNILGNVTSFNETINIVIPINTLGIAIIIIIATVFITSFIPIRRVAKKSPMDLIRQNDECSKRKTVYFTYDNMNVERFISYKKY